jgi:hypothetical protein
MEDVGIDILTYELLRRLPKALETIKQKITHSKDGEEINPKALIDHLKIHLKELKVSKGDKSQSIETTMFTDGNTLCKTGVHNPNSISHVKENCWFVYPEKRKAWQKKKQGLNSNNVSSFYTFSSNPLKVFILDSGSTFHMISDKSLFIHLDKTEKGVINTSCGFNTLRIEGKGTIKRN